MEDRLTLAYAQRVWSALEDDDFREDLERSFAKLCYVRGLPRDRFEDFNYMVYDFCARRAGEFDDRRSCLKTWMIMQARGIIISIVRGECWPSRAIGLREIPESDLRRDDFVQEGSFYIEQNVFAPSIDYELGLERGEIARQVINEQIMIYAEMLDGKEKACLDLMIATGFSISDTDMARALGFGGHSTAGKMRKKLYGELGLRLVKFGITLDDIDHV